MEIREKQIEDILVSSPSLVQRTFGMEEEPRLIGRQIIVPSGRLDMQHRVWIITIGIGKKAERHGKVSASTM